ncbi:Dual specificity phosphatase catalytic domain [Carpediemonas membranifera]|uniref:Dual specificity phosphatase catalytic domain n=1 Tax=Carpediemonas membranifera TaxID=201153 RepID=A0A8J6EAP3_9EUKA|nr:Dual specificity phosphatase catalytic domain [Carpediemonas membranifera]|eukprot:KAG9395005.1 Dual specificity phosphatase catalytic domain [Carpediemonas membranifera]
MGNYLSLERKLENSSQKQAVDSVFRSNVKVWRFSDGTIANELAVDSNLVDFSNFEAFEARCVYVILHVFITGCEVLGCSDLSATTSPDMKRMCLDSARNRETRKLSALVRSFADSISADPLTAPYYGARDIRTLDSEGGGGRWITYEIHVARGVSASPFASGMALAKAVQLQSILHDDDGQALPSLLDSPSAAAATSLFEDDLLNFNEPATEAALEAHPVITRLHEGRFRRFLDLPCEPTPTECMSRQIRRRVRHSMVSSPDGFSDSDDSYMIFSESASDFTAGPSGPHSCSRASSPLELTAFVPPSIKDSLQSVQFNVTPRSMSPSGPQTARGPHAVDRESPVVALPTNRVALQMEHLIGDVRPPELDRKAKVSACDPMCSQITSFLFLASYTVASNRATLEANGITHILNMAGSVCPNMFPGNFEYRTYSLYDGPTQRLEGLLIDCIHFIEHARRQGGKVLVHCQLGVSRSSSVVIAYLMWQTRGSYDDVYRRVKALRPVASPNAGFMCQLLHWRQRLQNGLCSTPTLFMLQLVDPTNTTLVTTQRPGERPSARMLDSRFVSVVAMPSMIYVYVGALVPDEHKAAHVSRATTVVRLYTEYGLMDGAVAIVQEADFIASGRLTAPLLFAALGLPPDAPVTRGDGNTLKLMGSAADMAFLDAYSRTRKYDEQKVALPPRPTPGAADRVLLNLPQAVTEFDAAFELFTQPTVGQVKGCGSEPHAAPEVDATGKALARLFEVTVLSEASVDFEELELYDSDDLTETSVFILDPLIGSTLFVWVGEEYDGEWDPVDIAAAFDQTERRPVAIVDQDDEPEEFWDFFWG